MKPFNAIRTIRFTASATTLFPEKRMLRSSALALVVSLYISSCTPSLYAQATKNLSSQGYYADPEVRIFDHQYWIYPTRSVSADDPAISQPPFNSLQTKLRQQHVIHKDYLLQTGLDAFSSPDLVHWTKHNSVLSVKNVAWAAYAIWAPSAIHLNGKYYLFFASNDIQKTDTFDGGIGVAVSDKPGGPFLDAIGRPLIGKFEHGAQPIDPMVYQDDDGSIYLYYGGQGHCVVARLSQDLKHVIPMSDGELYKEITPEHYVEGPFMIKRKGTYYFMWSEGDWGGSDYGVAYAKSASPIGPFTRAGKILQTDPAIAKGPAITRCCTSRTPMTGTSSTIAIRWTAQVSASASWPSTKWFSTRMATSSRSS